MSQNSSAFKISTIVIDAGHGGKDPGAIGKKSKEKDLTLAVALALGEKVQNELKNIKVIYTRKDDQFVELFERANIANRNKADLFISIHINSSKSQEAHGAETWVLGLHRSDENLNLAKRENAVLEFEGNIEQNYGFDPNSPTGNIIITMQQSAFLNQSIQFAKYVERQFIEKSDRQNRGVHQAGFIVLYKTVMPSCLIELGFISNKDEELYMGSAEGQEEISNSIFIALKQFIKDYDESLGKKNNTDTDKEETLIIKKVDNSNTENNDKKEIYYKIPNNNKKEEIRDEKVIKSTNIEEDDNSEINNKADVPIIEKKKPKTEKTIIPSVKKEGSSNSSDDITDKETFKEAFNKVINNNKKKESQKESQKEKPVEKLIEKPKVQSIDNSESNPIREYRVQVKANPTPIEENNIVFKINKDVIASNENGVYKYVCGNYTDRNEAKIRLAQAIKDGFKDAFIAVYENGVRVGIKK